MGNEKKAQRGWVAVASGCTLALLAFYGPAGNVWADECTDDAVAMIDELDSTVNELVESTGLRNGLLKKLREAQGALTDDNSNNDHVALRKLGDFKDQVEGATPKRISEPDAQLLLEDADAIVAALNACGVG